MAKPIHIPTLLRRWDDAAYDQLCAHAARLAEENEVLRAELAYANETAESWREDALQLLSEACAAKGAQPGLTRSGALVVVPVAEASCG